MWRRTIGCGLLMAAAAVVIITPAPSGDPAPPVPATGLPGWVRGVAWAVPLLPVLFVPLLVAALWPDPRRALRGLLVTAAGATLTLGIGTVLKNHVQGVRPCALSSAGEMLLSCPADPAYPSTVSALAAAVAVGVAVIAPRLAVAAAAIALLSAAGRVLGGVHSVPDVLAGLALGATVAGVLTVGSGDRSPEPSVTRGR
ncbi:membrane-associated phospholipid phosphatase [Catenuloplanes nepalensis]|uniref:Membrane-associated phospholipid phosphatase n=1 Tax=Catenuloplanes nepalensis TaxID=587533 RepID=A0ABT9MUE1_9ACTN|nr:phosphatase PAP2 family protein [Catenuloplanes nepalensis]MDP9795044.1 membrane-associated phospholipid phosphatase [Catenuloplanes nepalensis]